LARINIAKLGFIPLSSSYVCILKLKYDHDDNDNDNDKGIKPRLAILILVQINFACIVSISFVVFEEQNPFR
jgi:hypothetical protein